MENCRKGEWSMKTRVGKHKKAQIVIAGGIVLLAITGCLKTPEAEYVTNKEGLSTLVQDHISYDNGISIAQQCNAPQQVTEEIEETNPYTTIEINAKVLLSEGTAIPIYQLRLMDIDNARLENYTQVLFGDEGFYQYTFGAVRTTKAEIQESIDYFQNLLETETLDEEWRQIYQSNLETLWNQLESIEEVPGYGSPVSYEYSPAVEQIWFDDDIELDWNYKQIGFTGMRDGKEYDLLAFQSKNNEELVFQLHQDTKTECGYFFGQLSIVEQYRNRAVEMNDCRYSVEEAEELCVEFLKELGIENMQAQYISDLELYGNGTVENSDSILLGRKGYGMVFCRTYGDMGDDGGALLDQDGRWAARYYGETPTLYGSISNAIYQDYWENRKTSWDGEAGISGEVTLPEVAYFMVLDDGIVSMRLINPMEPQEQLAENVKLLDFQRVLAQGQTQMEVLYGNTGSNSCRRQYKIQVIELNYARMQSPNTEGEFILVPVWDFKTGVDGNPLITINAIDGSNFDRQQGY